MQIRKDQVSLFALLTGLALGSWQCTYSPPPGDTHRRPRVSGYDCSPEERNHAIFVFDDGSVTEECARISKVKNNKILWISASGADLKIDLVVENGRAVPFDKMACDPPNAGGDRVCHVDCKKERCRTGKFSDDYHPSALGDYYRYASTVGLFKGSDPGMMIDP
jgi:hypothetical protein